jgi:hypothetical protein
METKQNQPLIEIDYINFTKKLINEPTQKAKTFFLRSLHSLHYEVNKGLYEQIIYQIDGLITELRDDIFEKTAKLFQRNPKRDYFELTKHYEINYINPNRGQFSVKDLEGLRDLVYQFNDEVLENKIDKHYRFLDMFLSFIKIDVNEVFDFISENELYKNVREEIDRNGVIYFQYFQRELRSKLEKQGNSKVFEIDIKDRFLPMIHKYYEWYEINKEATKKFEPNNFYEWIYEVMRSTEKEINKWFKLESQEINIQPPPAEKKQKQQTAKKENSFADANRKVDIFENIFKVRKNIKDSLHEFEKRESHGFSKRTLERAIKIKYNDNKLTFNSYVKRHLTDNLTDKNKKVNY